MSKMTKNQLKKMSMDELKAMLTDQYQQELMGDEKEADLIGMILDVQNAPPPPPADEADESVDSGDASAGDDEKDVKAPTPPVKKDVKAKVKRGPNERVWLKIFNDDSPTGQQDVFVSVNDDNANIKREQWVYVKMLHVRALARAMETHYRREKNEHGQEVSKTISVRRYKFEVRNGGPTDMPQDAENDDLDALSAVN